jgi:hypothetical protein
MCSPKTDLFTCHLMILLGASTIVVGLCGFSATHATATFCEMLVSVALWSFAVAVAWRRAASMMQAQRRHYLRAGGRAPMRNVRSAS